MSSPEEHTELKGGHPPAVKAGGMRITQHKVAEKQPNEPKKEENKDEEEEEVTEEVVEAPKPNLVISGALARGDEDFPSAAIKAYHVKPVPTNQYRQASTKPTVIHQPRK